MSIAPGTRLGPYEIVAPLGVGGMGEVFRARDTRLDRSVAIKILPAAFSADAQLKSRLEREARAISQLNHPHICSLFDVGSDNGTDYLVMELIEGQTLADRLSRGALPFDEITRYGAEIADALETAHRSGIVHRDLKPQNIMITRSGTKLLDFGLAKTTTVDVAGDGSTAMQQSSLTREGTIVGTLHYMSPEQLEGHAVDHRSDLFALGAVLHEMATGRRAFGGETRSSVIAAIVSSEPAPVPQPALQKIIRQCLTKDPDERIQSAHDVALQLRAMEDSPATIAGKPSMVPWLIAAVLALTIGGMVFYHLRTRPVSQPIRFTIPAPPNTAIDGVPAISPDGRNVVFRTVSLDGSALLWLRALDSLDAKPLKGTEGASFAFWSPDGRNLGFIARGKLWRLELSSGDIRTIYEPVEDTSGAATWNRNDVIVFSPRVPGTLFQISASGGEAVPVTGGASNSFAIWPWFLPDGDHFVFYAEPPGAPGLYVGRASAPHTAPKLILKDRGASRPIYAAGFLFYAHGSSLYARKFDPRTLEVQQDVVKIDDDVQRIAPERASFSVSDGGTIVYRKHGAPLVAQLIFADRTGRRLGILGDPGPYSSFRISPDDRRVVFTRLEDHPAVWILDARGAAAPGVQQRWSMSPVWAADGRSIVYSAAVNGSPNVYLHRSDGSSERITNNDQQNYPTSVTPDGQYAIYDFSDPETNFDIYAVPIASPHKAFPIVKSRFREEEGVVSPDGRWLAYTSDESGTKQIYAIAFPRGSDRVQISNGGGVSARWSRDGRELFYFQPATRHLMAVRVEQTGGELRPSVPVTLFAMATPNFDVTSDGRFLVAEVRLNSDAPGLTVLMK